MSANWVKFGECRLLVAGVIAALCATSGCALVNERVDFQLAPAPAETAAAWRQSVTPREPAPIRQATFRAPVLVEDPPAAPAEQRPVQPTTLDDFVRLAVERNPRLARATFAIDAARGRYTQAGLYPNPDLAVNWDEIGDRQDPGGILTIPRVSQTIITGKKLTLPQAVAAREVDQATLELVTERYAIIGSVRSTFYEVFALQRRAEILAELVKLANEAVMNGQKLLDNKQIARLDLIQLEIERERLRAELQAVRQELPATYRRLAAISGHYAIIPDTITATFDNLPTYDPKATLEAVLAFHPQIRSAHVAVSKAQAAIRRAQAEPIPDVTLSTGFVRQFENKSYDGAFAFSLPVPVWNRNQGNIRAAQAELGMAIQAVGQLENELAARVATAFQTYASARERAELYRKELIPRAEETFRMSLEAFKGGQFEYLRVIQAQRALIETRLEYNKSLGEAWRAAGELSGLLLEESWPNTQPAPMPMLIPIPPGAKAP